MPGTAQVVLVSVRKDVIDLCRSLCGHIINLKIVDDLSQTEDLLSSACLYDCSAVTPQNASSFFNFAANQIDKVFLLIPSSLEEPLKNRIMSLTDFYTPYPCTLDMLKSRWISFYESLCRFKNRDINPGKLKKNFKSTLDAQLMGSSLVMKNLRKKIELLANGDGPVLLLGESGTGKTKTAELLHTLSSRGDYNFTHMNISAVPENLVESTLFGTADGAYTDATTREGLFKMADHGTLFLDEIGTATLGTQSKLLTVLDSGKFYSVGSDEEKSVDVRMMFATNDNLKLKILQELFRKDLYFRIAVNIIELPPLREHKEDIRSLASHFAGAKGKYLTDGAFSKLEDYNWPGNIRQLENCIEQSASNTEGEVIDAADITFTM